MHISTYISTLGHGGLLGWLVLGGVLAPDPVEFETVQVTTISAQEFAALNQGPQPVVPSLADPVQPAVPLVETPQTPEQVEDTPPDPVQPVVPEASASDDVPEVSDVPPPQVEIPEEAPVAPTPPSAGVTADMPEVSDTPPQAQEAPRVAPIPVAEPSPNQDVADTITPETAPDVDADAEAVVEPQEAAAPEQATTEIVTEAETPSGAPTTSLRPASRPERPTRPADEPDPMADAIAGAVAEAAINDPPTPAQPAGPPLTSGEMSALRVSVSSCWNVGSLSSEALRTTVTVAVSMEQDGTPKVATIRLVGSQGGSAAAANQAFEAARRAIIRCGARGYSLPAEKYAQWQEIEMTFNPESMRIK